MHKHIEAALRAKPKLILVDVRMTKDTDLGSPVIETQKRGDAFCGYTTVAELEANGKPEFVAEGRAYKHVYFCDETVPANVVDIFNGRSL